jgi:histidine ammonia-lyase
MIFLICYRPWTCDRFMAPDIDAATNLLKNNKIWEVVQPFISSYSEDKFGTVSRPDSPTTSFSELHSRKRSRLEAELP